MFCLKSLFIVHIIPCGIFNNLTSTTTIFFNRYYSLHFFRAHNNNCSIDLCNRNLQTTIILFTRKVSSHKIDWILAESPFLALSYIWHRIISNLINAREIECLWLREISINVNKLFTVVCGFCLCPPCSIVVACLLVYPLFYTDVVAIFFFI